MLTLFCFTKSWLLFRQGLLPAASPKQLLKTKKQLFHIIY